MSGEAQERFPFQFTDIAGGNYVRYRGTKRERGGHYGGCHMGIHVKKPLHGVLVIDQQLDLLPGGNSDLLRFEAVIAEDKGVFEIGGESEIWQQNETWKPTMHGNSL